MAELLPAAVSQGGCEPGRCTVRHRLLRSAPSPWHVTVFTHDAGAGVREVVVAVHLAGQRIGEMGGCDRAAMDRLCDAWDAAFRTAFPRHHAEAWADG